MLFTLTFIGFFIAGDVTGVFLPVMPLDMHLQDTYFVLGHFHYVVNAIMLGALGMSPYYFPHITSRRHEERLAKGNWLLLTVGGGITHTFTLAAGVLGTPRRYAAAPDHLHYPYHVVMTVGIWLIAASVVLYLLSLPWGRLHGHPVAGRENPWGVSKFGLKDVVPPAFHPPHVHTSWPAAVGLATMPLALGLLNILAAMPTSVLSGAASPSPLLGWGSVALFVALGPAWLKFDTVDRALAMRVMNGAHHIEIPKPPSA
jgi:cytochrome aa3-600 menaquinol oxidase subunit 3